MKPFSKPFRFFLVRKFYILWTISPTNYDISFQRTPPFFLSTLFLLLPSVSFGCCGCCCGFGCGCGCVSSFVSRWGGRLRRWWYERSTHLFISQKVPRPSFPKLKYFPSEMVEPGRGKGGRGSGLIELEVAVILHSLSYQWYYQATLKD